MQEQNYDKTLNSKTNNDLNVMIYRIKLNIKITCKKNINEKETLTF